MAAVAPVVPQSAYGSLVHCPERCPPGERDAQALTLIRPWKLKPHPIDLLGSAVFKMFFNLKNSLDMPGRKICYILFARPFYIVDVLSFT